MIKIAISSLSKAAFTPYGDVIETDGAQRIPINQGFAERFNDLATIDVNSAGGTANVSVIAANPRPLPIVIKLMERHPLGSQLFFPLQDKPWMVLVCSDPKNASSYRAFAANGRQGVNYGRGVWHHPLLVFDSDSRFMVVDRQGPGNNLEELWLEEGQWHCISP